MHCFDYPFARLQRTDHQYDRPIGRQPKLRLALRTRKEALGVDPVRDQGRVPFLAISLQVKGIGADQPFAREKARFQAALLRCPITILSHEHMGRSSASPRPTERPASIGIAACHRDVGGPNLGKSQ